jgi:hypothetical protein
MESEYGDILCYTGVCWLSHDRMPKHMYDLSQKLNYFWE